MTDEVKIIDEGHEEDSDAGNLFAELLDQYEYVRPRQGQILQGEILRIEEDAVFMDIGAKRDAIVPHTDLDLLSRSLVDSLEQGKEIPVYILKTPSGDEELLVSINKGMEQQDWNRAVEMMEGDEAEELDIVAYNKGGLIVQFGQLQGFVPNSHVPDLRYGGQDGTLESRKARKVGETLLVKVLEVDQDRRRLIFSAKSAYKEQRKRHLRDLEVGSVITGRVVNLVDYGAFVEIGHGISGLLHVSELAWHRVDRPDQVLSEGEEIEVQIQNVDVDRERIGLSRKAVMPNPWDTIEARYNIGDLITGTVTNVEDFGAFVEVQTGVVGLIHVSEIDIFSPATVKDVVQRGDEVLVRIIDIDPYEERLSLSLRRVTSEEQIEWMRRQKAKEAAEAEAAESDEVEMAVEDEADVAADAELEAETMASATDGADDESALAEQTEPVSADEDAQPEMEATDVAESAPEITEDSEEAVLEPAE